MVHWCESVHATIEVKSTLEEEMFCLTLVQVNRRRHSKMSRGPSWEKFNGEFHVEFHVAQKVFADNQLAYLPHEQLLFDYVETFRLQSYLRLPPQIAELICWIAQSKTNNDSDLPAVKSVNN